MNALRWLLEPAEETPASRAAGDARLVALAARGPVAGGAPAAAVLGRAGEAEPVAAALALALCRRMRVRSAVVAVLGVTAAAPATPPPVEAGEPPPEPGAIATRAARRLAVAVEARGLTASARGRLAWARPAGADAHAMSATRRAAALGAPTVLAVTAPRSEALDALLAEQDLLLLVAADPDAPLAALAAADLAATGIPLAVVRALPAGPTRALATAGLGCGRLAAEVRAAVAGRCQRGAGMEAAR